MIIRRWQEYTGAEAELEGSGGGFAAVAVEQLQATGEEEVSASDEMSVFGVAVAADCGE